MPSSVGPKLDAKLAANMLQAVYSAVQDEKVCTQLANSCPLLLLVCLPLARVNSHSRAKHASAASSCHFPRARLNSCRRDLANERSLCCRS